MKLTLLITCLLVITTATAQLTKDSLINRMGIQACKAMEGKDLSKLNKSNAQQEIGLLLLPVFSNNATEIAAVYGGNLMDQAVMQKVGTDIAMNLISNCPKFMEFSMAMAGNNGGKQDEVDANTTLKGTLVSVVAGDIATMNVKNSKGVVQKLYVLTQFEDDDNVIANPKKYLNKKIVVTFNNMEVYNATTKKYKSIKVLEAISLD